MASLPIVLRVAARLQGVVLEFIALDSNPDWRRLRVELRQRGAAASIAVTPGDDATMAEVIAPSTLRAFRRQVERLSVASLVREVEVAAGDLPGCDGMGLSFRVTEGDGAVTSCKVGWLNDRRVPALASLIAAVRRVVAETPLPRAARERVARLSDYLSGEPLL